MPISRDRTAHQSPTCCPNQWNQQSWSTRPNRFHSQTVSNEHCALFYFHTVGLRWQYCHWSSMSWIGRGFSVSWSRPRGLRSHFGSTSLPFAPVWGRPDTKSTQATQLVLIHNRVIQFGFKLCKRYRHTNEGRIWVIIWIRSQIPMYSSRTAIQNSTSYKPQTVDILEISCCVGCSLSVPWDSTCSKIRKVVRLRLVSNLRIDREQWWLRKWRDSDTDTLTDWLRERVHENQVSRKWSSNPTGSCCNFKSVAVTLSRAL